MLYSSAKVSAFNTRNAVLVFAAFGLFLILLDTILHVTALINRLPPQFDLAVNIKNKYLINNSLFLNIVYYCYACIWWHISYSCVGF
jgi:hypothetical protein